MAIYSDLASAVGHTPLIRLNKVSEATGCEILGKAEFLNPGQSVKDRAALYIIRDAVERGELEPGGTIVEGTAGNTGIGLALVGASMGFETVIVIPETQSQEKKDMIRLAGAELVQVPAVPYRNPNNYVRYSGRLADKLKESSAHGAVWANQFDNTANRRAHVEGTGPEIWEQTSGKVDGFVCAVGTGGTLAGVAEALGEALDAPVICSNFSRLVIDPNRGEDDPTLLMKLYDGTIIPGNRHAGEDEREARLAACYRPYHAALGELAARPGAALLSIHSFTPRLRGRPPRPWQVGVLFHEDDARLARPLLDRLRAEPDLTVGENEPYPGHLPGDAVDRHALRHGRPNVLIELRQDLIATPACQREWATRLAPLLEAARATANL